MCIVDSKPKLIHRPGIKGNESILDERFESFPSSILQQFKVLGLMRQEFLGLSKARGRRPVHTMRSLLQGRLLLYLAGVQLTCA